MLTTMLDRLGTLLSRQFIVSYFVPVLVFAFLNALLLAWQVSAFRVWAPAQFEGLKGFYALPVLIGFAVVAYFISSVSVYLRQVLEGRRLLPDVLLKEWVQQQHALRESMSSRLKNARDRSYELQRQKPHWRARLVNAGDQGLAAPRGADSYDESNAAAREIAELEKRRTKVEAVSKEDIETAVTALESVLEVMDRGAGTADARRLYEDYLKLLEILDYAEEVANIERSAAMNDVERSFSVDELRATRMGNVAAALDSYGETRYRMNLAVYWSRMQLIIQDKKEIYGALVDAKCQLDFLVVCCWLCILTSAGWLVGMQWLPFSWLLYLLVLIVVPIGARFFYLLAVENYAVMADLIKSTVDLFRFQLLRNLHVPQPGGIRQERALWAALGDLTSGKEGLEISYQHDGP